METYIIKSIFASGLLTGYYWIVLRKTRLHRFNRFYILGALTLSLLLPAIHVTWYDLAKPIHVPIYLIPGANTQSGHPVASTLSMAFWITLGSFVVSFTLLCILIQKIMWIFRIKHSHPKVRMQGYTLIETDVAQAPFSFLDTLFWKIGTPLTTGIGGKILRHELTHIRQGHTYDKLYAQLLICLCWMNPFFWLLQKELNMVHEFIADAGALDQGDTESFAKMLLQSSFPDAHYFDPVHSFFHSPIKRRLFMINLPIPDKPSYWRQVLTLPTTVLVVLLLTVSLGYAQTDTGTVKIIHVRFIDPRANAERPGDSVVTMRVVYAKAGGRIDSLTINNVGFKNGPPNPYEVLSGTNAIKFEALNKERENENYADEVKTKVTAENAKNVRHWLASVILSPPDYVYFLNGKKISREDVKKLDPEKITDVNIKEGVVSFTTETNTNP
jgi:hypothetical protein